MAASRLDPTRQEFLERLLVQMCSRYPAWVFCGADESFAIVGRKDRVRLTLSLTGLHAATLVAGARVPEEITRFVAAAGPRLSAAEESPTSEGETPDRSALVWCVRTARVIERYPRANELLSRPMPAGLIAFVAEALPGEIMRGVSRLAAARGGIPDAELMTSADRNTAVRLDSWRQKLAAPPRAGRWLFTDDVLFSSSLLLVSDFLSEVADKGGGHASLVVPDRGVLVAAIAEGANPAQLRHVARRLYGRSTSPLSPQLLATDGGTITLHPSEREARRPWSGWRQVLGLGER